MDWSHGISPGVVFSLVNTITARVQNIKVYRGRCRNLELRCHVLLSALNEDHGRGPPSAAHADALSEAEATLLIVRDRVNGWAMLNRIQSLLRQDDIREGIDDLHRRVDTCIAACHVRISRQMAQTLRELSEQTLDTQEEFRVTMQEVLVAFREYLENPTTLPNFRLAVDRSIQVNSANDDSSYSFDSQSQAFSDAIREFGRSMATLELTHPMNMPTSSRNSLTSVARQSSIRSDSSVPRSPLEVALTTHVGVWKTSEHGVITTATMKGLIQYLLLKCAEKDKKEHDIFFIAHPAFISPLYVLEMLFRQFEEASEHPDETRDDIQERVIHLINSWLCNQHVIFSIDYLTEVRNFMVKVHELNTLDELVLETIRGINEKASLLNFSLAPLPIIPSSDSIIGPTPRQLAMALARLEGERYQRILPVEYMSYAGKLHSFSPNLTEAIALNQRIHNWVQSSLLDMDLDEEKRCTTKRFFVKTAEACREIRNFSSLGAIMGALESKAISSLTLTHKRMRPEERYIYQKLVDILKSDSNYQTYRKTLSKVESRGCIPWHVVHLHDIHGIMRKEKDVDEQHHPPQINFKKWVHLKEKAMSTLQYRDVPFKFDEPERDIQAAMDYLMKALQDITLGEDFSRDLQKNSERLVKNESLTRGHVREVLKDAGFG